MRTLDSETLEMRAHRMRSEELGRMARALALEWRALFHRQAGPAPSESRRCPVPVPRARPDSPATPSA